MIVSEAATNENSFPDMKFDSEITKRSSKS